MVSNFEDVKMKLQKNGRSFQRIESSLHFLLFWEEILLHAFQMRCLDQKKERERQ